MSATAAAFANRTVSLGKFEMPDAPHGGARLYELKVEGLEGRFFGGISTDATRYVDTHARTRTYDALANARVANNRDVPFSTSSPNTDSDKDKIGTSTSDDEKDHKGKGRSPPLVAEPIALSDME